MYGHRSEKRTIPISGSFALRWPASDRNNPAAWRRGVSVCRLVSARHRMRPAETNDIVYQGSRIAVPPSAHGRGDVQTARMCHRTAVLLVKVSAGGSLLWSPLVAPSASAAMKTQRSQAAMTSRPLGNR